jgi:hypothetical protein
MKNKLIIISVGLVGMLMSGCNDSFMDKYPETSITENVFFSTPADLKTYTNGFYSYISPSIWDVPSDNCVYVDECSLYSLMRGEITPKNAGKWSWTNIRNVNFMLARTGKTTGDKAEINHYIGLARLFRAILYYGKVQTYSDVPWYSTDLKTTDTELLYKTQDSRALVVDSIMADLDYATTNMKSGKGTRLYKEAALAYQARIALNEGTFRKYHSELGLNDADKYFQIAAKACEAIMATKKFSLNSSYAACFQSLDLSSNPEMIFYKDYDKTLDVRHNAASMYDWEHTLSRDLMEDYVFIQDNKAIPFTQVAGYDKMDVDHFYLNRDPRLKATFWTPGYKRVTSVKPTIPTLGHCGYPQIKFEPQTADQISWNMAYTDLPIIRYAEVLLMDAEAKAELGTLTQADVDNTINVIRQRAGVPSATLSDWLSNIDPKLAAHYPNVTSAQKGAILEIRRERRVELACEGFRENDLMRWGCAKLLETAPEGIYIDKLGYQDLNGDGNPDVAIVATKADADAIPAADKTKYGLVVFTLAGNTFALTNGTSGYLRLLSQVGKFTFTEPKYYYYPLDEQDMLINTNLVQNKYWK